ncbi:TetR/AcrR family transcriptional regulator [Chloroflexota bacterium]
MSGLRERQKERKGQAIITATRELLDIDGYQGASIEKIAARAEVSVGTVYNYFDSKDNLMLSLFLDDVKDIIEKGLSIVGNPSDDAVTAVSALLKVYAEEIAGRYSKRLMRELFASFFGESTSQIKEMFKLDFMLTSQLGELIEQLQKRGKLASDIKTEEAAIIIYSVFGIDFLLFVSDNDMTLASLVETMRRSTELVFRGFMPR